jgi:uncharacterized lipoprotein
MKRIRLLLLLPVCVFAGACNLLPDAYTGCGKVQLYQSAQELPPLRVPDGSIAPDTRNAMRIPAVSMPQVPPAEGRCLDHPPSYAGKPVAG